MGKNCKLSLLIEANLASAQKKRFLEMNDLALLDLFPLWKTEKNHHGDYA